jgi:serine/threonine protein kinase
MAIKTVHAKSEEAIADVKHEMSILQSCRNKYIVAYYGCWGPDSKKRLWILYDSIPTFVFRHSGLLLTCCCPNNRMDYCGVGSVMDLVETISIVDMKPTEQQVAFIIYSTLMALVYLNSRKIIHRGNASLSFHSIISLSPSCSCTIYRCQSA